MDVYVFILAEVFPRLLPNLTQGEQKQQKESAWLYRKDEGTSFGHPGQVAASIEGIQEYTIEVTTKKLISLFI